MKRLVMTGEWIGCGQRRCVKGRVRLRGADVPCEVCVNGYIRVWTLTDKTKLRAA